MAVLNMLDFFTPMVDKPEIQGRIAGSNVTSDIYTLAVTKIPKCFNDYGVSREHA